MAYPRIFRALREVGLTSGEAESCIASAKRGDKWSSEAVNVMGGVGEAIRAALHRRRIVRRKAAV